MFILEHKISERRACSLIGMSRSQFRYTSQKKEDAEVLRAIIKIKARHKYYGVPRVLATLRRDGFIVNGKRVYRILKNLNQMVDQKKKRKNRFIPPSAKTPDAIGPNEVWSMDFVFDRLADGTPFRCYTIVDNYTREVPGILASKSMAGFSPVKYLEGLKSKRHLPKHFF